MPGSALYFTERNQGYASLRPRYNMPTFPTPIPTRSLKLSDVPDEASSWSTIGRFALTFDPAEKDPYRLEVQGLATLPADSSLVLLRAYLFLEQRRWNHFGREPDVSTMSAVRRIVTLIREKLSEQDKSVTEAET
jgi:hypothetical protein